MARCPLTGGREVKCSVLKDSFRWDHPFPRTGCILNCASYSNTKGSLQALALQVTPAAFPDSSHSECERPMLPSVRSINCQAASLPSREWAEAFLDQTAQDLQRSKMNTLLNALDAPQLNPALDLAAQHLVIHFFLRITHLFFACVVGEFRVLPGAC